MSNWAKKKTAEDRIEDDTSGLDEAFETVEAVATEVSKPVGVNFLALNANKPHVFNELFAIEVPNCSSCS